MWLLSQCGTHVGPTCHAATSSLSLPPYLFSAIFYSSRERSRGRAPTPQVMAGGGGEEGADSVEGGELDGREREPGGGVVVCGRRKAARHGGSAACGRETAQRGGIGAAPGGGRRGGSGAKG